MAYFNSNLFYHVVDSMIEESLEETLLSLVDDDYRTVTTCLYPFYPQRTSTDKIVSDFQNTNINKIYTEYIQKKGE